MGKTTAVDFFETFYIKPENAFRHALMFDSILSCNE